MCASSLALSRSPDDCLLPFEKLVERPLLRVSTLGTASFTNLIAFLVLVSERLQSLSCPPSMLRAMALASKSVELCKLSYNRTFSVNAVPHLL